MIQLKKQQKHENRRWMMLNRETDGDEPMTEATSRPTKLKLVDHEDNTYEFRIYITDMIKRILTHFVVRLDQTMKRTDKIQIWTILTLMTCSKMMMRLPQNMKLKMKT